MSTVDVIRATYMYDAQFLIEDEYSPSLPCALAHDWLERYQASGIFVDTEKPLQSELPHHNDVQMVLIVDHSVFVGIWKPLGQGHCIASLVQVVHHHRLSFWTLLRSYGLLLLVMNVLLL